MGKVKGKKKKGLNFAKRKKTTYTCRKIKYDSQIKIITRKCTPSKASFVPKSSARKRSKVSSTPRRKPVFSPNLKCRSTQTGKRKLSLSIRLLTSPFRKSPLSKRKTSTPAKGSKRKLMFQQNISFEACELTQEMSAIIASDSEDELESKGTRSQPSNSSNNDLTERKDIQSARHLLDDIDQDEFFDNLEENFTSSDLKAKLLRFIELVKEEKFPLDNVALQLFLDTVTWFDRSDVRQMRYSPIALNFFWLGKKLFEGRFIRYMSGPKNETDFLTGKEYLEPGNSSINFACPHENVLRTVNPLGGACNVENGPGLVSEMIELKAEKGNKEVSFVLMFDGKKVRRGSDENLIGFEEGMTLSERQEAHDKDIAVLNSALEKIKVVREKVSDMVNIPEGDITDIRIELKSCLDLMSINLMRMRELKK